MFQYTRDVNCRQTRSNDCMSNHLYLPRPKTENYRRDHIATRRHFLEQTFTECTKCSSVNNFKSEYLMGYFNSANI